MISPQSGTSWQRIRADRMASDKPVSTTGFRASKVRSRVLAMIVRKGGGHWPPSLNSVPTELDKLYEDGGPANLASEPPDKRKFKTPCDEYPLQRIVPLLQPFCKEERAIRRHWPWTALALSRYLFEIKEWGQYPDERSPKEWKELLQAIAKGAHELETNLAEVQAATHRLTDPSAPLRRGHIAWFDELFARAAAGRVDSTEADDNSEMTMNHFAKQAFLRLLVDVERSAKSAIKNLDPRLLTRKRGQNNPALNHFVWLTARTWNSLTGRRASAQRLNSKDREDPDFVLFVSALAKLGRAPSPSRREIETSLRNRPTN
jgi:hypothetical protein